MHPFELSQLSEDLWGQQWASVLADKFEVKTKSVKRWANGTNQIPQAVIEFVLFHKAKKGASQ